MRQERTDARGQRSSNVDESEDRKRERVQERLGSAWKTSRSWKEKHRRTALKRKSLIYGQVLGTWLMS